MRDPDRIDEILQHLARIWKENPDFRLGQLIVNAAKPPAHCPSVFYVEDDQLLRGMLDLEARFNAYRQDRKD